MNKRDQEQFAAFFEEIYETEELLDFIKLQLVQSTSYNPSLLFDLISAQRPNITIQQLRSYLDGRVAFNQRQMYQIFERFDWSRQGFIFKSDFLNELVPFGRQVQSLNNTEGALTAEIEGHFISLLVEILKRFRIVEVLRKQIKYIQPYDAFQHLDYLKKGNIGIPQLRKFFFENDFNVNDRQLYYLLHGLRRRCYRDINLQVFCENLWPLEFGFYVAYQARLDEELQASQLSRSRQQEEVMKRSRQQAQRIQHELMKAQRKKQAELQRQLQLEDRVGAQIIHHEHQKQQQIRRAMLEEDRNIRYELASAGEVYRQELLQRQYQNNHLNSIRLRQQEKNAALDQSSYERQKELDLSRRSLNLEKEQLQREEYERTAGLIRSAAVARELEISRRRLEQQSRRKYQEDLRHESRRVHEDQIVRRRADENEYRKMLEASRREVEESRRLRLEEDRKLDELRRKSYETSSQEQQRLYRELELERQRARQSINQIRSNRIGQYEKQLEKTRYDIAADRSRRTGDLSSSYR